MGRRACIAAACLLAAGCAGSRGSAGVADAETPDSAVDAAPAWKCGSQTCEAGEACVLGVHECVAHGSDDCASRIVRGAAVRGVIQDVTGNWPFGGGQPPFQGGTSGTIAEVTPSRLTLDLQGWGTRTLDFGRDDLEQLFRAGESVDVRLCMEIPSWLINRVWLIEISTASIDLTATGDLFEYHGRCLPRGVRALDHGPTECAAYPLSDFGALPVPAVLTLEDGTVLGAWAGERVDAGAVTLDVRSSSLRARVAAECADCPSSELQFFLERRRQIRTSRPAR